MNRRSTVLSALVAGAVVAAGCGGDDPTDPPEQDLAPNLAGTYDLSAFSSALVTGGQTLQPPDVSGIFVLRQDPPTGNESMGTFEMSISVPDGLGGTTAFDDEGTYTVRSDGTWEQFGNLNQARGTYTLESGTFTVTVTEPPLAVSLSVWQRR
ncbi:MAG: hypothetical protein F4087_10970 [Gemmatimonadetes bacterium]|nr:hypothetical protein [Gemmatimonadota bacterium]MDE2678752.1 hypothetical protein [Gemmatimonadota bacterium]MXX33306.1 hypothetical protein [Gemmatimonadota bacterium]MYA12736.1 hypothetical protein [Gemmatimonadota bacterium]MYD14216.1 hypothetical protein [Gemmatimonadota bacterium]